VSPEARAEVLAYARQLADEAPPLTEAQKLLLVSVFARYPRGDDGTVFPTASAPKG
jgi:hypothetical protein